MTIKVLHLIDSGGLYGAEVVLLNLVEEQVKAGLKPLILSAGTPDIEEKPLEKAALERGLPLKKWRMKAGLNLPEAWKILKFSKREGIEILHSHGYKFNLLMGVWPQRLRRMPLVTTLHGYVHAPTYTKLWLYELLDRAILKRMDSIVVVNPVMKSIPAVSAIDPRKVCEIANGIDVSSAPVVKQIDKIATQFLANHGPIIGAIGRLSKEKGLSHLVEAFAELRKRFPKSGLLLIGEGLERASLERLISEKGLEEHVLMPGYRADITSYMAPMDVLVMPSLTEGLPMTLLEAMHLGVPVVASSVGGIPKLLDSGRCGFLTDPKNIAQLVKSIGISLTLNKDQLERFKSLAHERVRTHYSSVAMSERYQELYQNLGGRSNRLWAGSTGE